MRTINLNEAKTNLSKLVKKASDGESFTITRFGKPLAKVAPIDAPAKPRRFGFLAGEISVPEDFDTMGAEDIAALFGAGQ